MMFAGHCRVNLMVDAVCRTTDTAHFLSSLFNEELGAVFQVRKRDEIHFHR